MADKNNKIISKNKKAFFEFEILDSLECGIELYGTEVKSIRQGSFSIAEAYVIVRRGELFLVNSHIAPYDAANRFNHDPKRDRKLLAHKSQIRKLDIAVQQKGMTLVPIQAYFSRGKVKLEVAIARGKKLRDKRETIKEREMERRLKRDYGRY